MLDDEDRGSANISFEHADKTDARILDLNESIDDNRIRRNSLRKRPSLMEGLPAGIKDSRLDLAANLDDDQKIL